MLLAVRNGIYLVSLKWKQGEVKSLGTFRGVRDDLLVLFDIPPAGEYDHELGVVLEPTEYLKQFGPRLAKAWGKRGVFIDAAQVDDQRHREGLSVHPLTELLERARLADSLAFPVTGPGRSAEYQAAVSRFAQTNPSLPVCIRVDAAAGFDSFASLVREIRLLLFELEMRPERCLLVVDFGAFDPHDVPGFAAILAERMNALPYLHDWLNVAVSMTAFPHRPKLKPGEIGTFKRTEWEVYQALLRSPLLRRPLFGDYAVEHPALGPTGRISPVAQLRYSTETDTLIFKGKTTKKPNGYEAIFPVADMLNEHPEFKGETYSLGDAYMERLARDRKSTGNASTWRWAATDHHLTRALAQLRLALGMPVHQERVLERVIQGQLEFEPRT